jgi:hypothetical protein
MTLALWQDRKVWPKKESDARKNQLDDAHSWSLSRFTTYVNSDNI